MICSPVHVPPLSIDPSRQETRIDVWQVRSTGSMSEHEKQDACLSIKIYRASYYITGILQFMPGLHIGLCDIMCIGPCMGLKSRPRPGPQIWFEAQARSGPVAVVQTGPGPARKINYEARAWPGQQKIYQARPRIPARKTISYLSPDPARARGPRAGPLARSHIIMPTKQQYYYCVHIIMWLLSCYIHNHMHFQCLYDV